MDEPKKSKKFLWVYTIALFSVALLLVILSSVRHQQATNTAKDLEEKYNQQIVLTQGVQADLEKLQQQQQETEKELSLAKENNKALQAQFDAVEKENVALVLLLQARQALDQEDNETAAALRQQVAEEDLNEVGQALLALIDEKLNS